MTPPSRPQLPPPAGHTWQPAVDINARVHVKGRSCSRRGCRNPAVGDLMRRRIRAGMHETVWWPYCESHLAGYWRWVQGGRVYGWRPTPERQLTS